MAAVYLDSIPIARPLLENGAMIEYTSPRFSVLYAARSVKMVQLLLDHGVAVQKLDSKRNTALHFAAKAGRLEVARLLVEHLPMADVFAENEAGNTPLIFGGCGWEA
jgi:ankyrin repeat protein